MSTILALFFSICDKLTVFRIKSLVHLIIYLLQDHLFELFLNHYMISNITYDNISAEYPKFWPIYIGPQQQKEPDGTGAGFWPNTNPNVNIKEKYYNEKCQYTWNQSKQTRRSITFIPTHKHNYE